MFKSKNILVLVLTIALVLGMFSFGHTAKTGRPGLYVANGIVTSTNYLASEAGVQILKNGGNAVDAWVAAIAVLTITQPSAVTPGGGGWMVFYSAEEDKVITLDFMGCIPYAAQFGLHADVWAATEGYKTGLVPGNIGGWAEALRKYGSMTFAEVLAPAIEYAENGFVADESYAKRVKSSKLLDYPSTRAVYLPDGVPPKVGEMVYNKDLAATYRQVAERGIEDFYTGEIAQKIVAFEEEVGGLLTARDLEEFEATWWDPITINYKGYDVYTTNPEGSVQGLQILQALKIMEGYDVQEWGLNSAEYLHHFVEAFKLGDADYWHFGVPEELSGVPVPIEELLSDKHADEQRARITDKATSVPGVPGYGEQWESSAETYASNRSISPGVGFTNTTGLATADNQGNFLISIQSAGMGFGSGVVVEGLGFTITSMMNIAEFVDADSVWALGRSRKVPVPMTPLLIMKDGKPFMAQGSGGTETIMQTTAQAFVNIVDFGLSPQEAVEVARWSNRGTWECPHAFELWRTNLLDIEVPEGGLDVLLELAKKGHRVNNRGVWSSSLGGIQLIMRDPETGTLIGVADPRRTGYAIGW